MLNRVIEWSLKNRLIIVLATLFIIAGGWVAVQTIPLDAIPDLSDAQVIVFTEFEGQAPQIVEDQVTYPLTTAMLSVPYAKVVRGYSFFGMSFVYIIFEDGTDLYWARSRVLEYLNFAQGRLPKGVTPVIGPDATGVGWVYEYAVVDRTGKHDLAQLRTLQDWYLRYELQKVPGVSEVASMGGYVKQYQIELDPVKLASYRIPLMMVSDAVKRSNKDVGGRSVEMAEREYLIRGKGYIRSIADIESIVVMVSKDGIPVRIKDLGVVHLGPDWRRGVTELNGEGQVTGGVVLLRYGGDALKTIGLVKERLAQLKAGLPEGVEIVPVYDRSALIQRAVSFLKEKLIEEFIIVALVCVLFLMHLRSSLVAIFTIPAGILASFIIMRMQGLNANIMSLGGIAIAIGVMVDAAIVMIENTHKHLERAPANRAHADIVREAVQEVGPALFFCLLIITVSFFPVFTLQAQEGKMFAPLAFTKTYAVAASALLAITLVPVMMAAFVKGDIVPEHKNPINLFLVNFYTPMAHFIMRWKKSVIAVTAAFLVLTAYPAMKLGSEFMPPLNEGDLLYMPTAFPGISVTKAAEMLQQTDRMIKTVPEVAQVFGKIGRAETATDSAMFVMVETTIQFKPKEEWRPGMTVEKLIKELDATVKIPGVSNAWVMPIKNRIDMLSTGIKTPVGIKVAGPDLKTIGDVAVRVEAALKGMPTTLSAFAERTGAGSYIDIDIDRERIGRYGLKVEDVQDVVAAAMGGMTVGETVEGRERYPINVRYQRELRAGMADLGRVLVPAPSGAQIPLTQVATLRFTSGPSEVKSENARLNAWVYVDIKDTDVGSYVKEAKRVVAEKVQVPPGVSIAWSGQYEYMERAKERLKLVVPMTLLIIFLLLYLQFRRVTEIVIVMLSIPLALIGSVWLLWYLDYNLSVAVGVGLIALAGVAVEIYVLKIMYIEHAIEARHKEGKMETVSDLVGAVITGTCERLRPIIMTKAAIIGGLLPIMYGTGTGSEIMKRIATPMVGGMLTTVLASFFVVPVVYVLVKSHVYRKE
ncbi:MAG: efflux RND transporter permease subunit [Nitrospinae bacterium]|nr:efflux RND transporter permease subunit [Nitrospinota bacterium]